MLKINFASDLPYGLQVNIRPCTSYYRSRERITNLSSGGSAGSQEVDQGQLGESRGQQLSIRLPGLKNGLSQSLTVEPKESNSVCASISSSVNGNNFGAYFTVLF